MNSIFSRVLTLTLSFSLAIPTHLFAQTVPAPGITEAEVSQLELDLGEHYVKNEGKLTDNEVVEPLKIDLFSLMAQKFYQEKVLVEGFQWQTDLEKVWENKKNFYNWNQLTLSLVNKEGQSTGKVRLADFDKQSVGYGNWQTCEGTSCRIELIKEDPNQALNNKTVQQFFLEARNVAVLGPYIIFTTGPNAKNLKFIDLYQFENLVGNESIPVFDIPLPVEGGIQTLESAGTHLKVNGKYYLGVNFFESLALPLSTIFNLSANLVDPETMAAAAPLYESVNTYLSRLYKDIEVETKDVNGVGKIILDQEQFLKQAKEQIDLAKMAGNANALLAEGQKVQDGYHQWLMQSDALKTSIKSTQAEVRSARKLLSKVRQTLGFITKPLPESSGVLKRAMKLLIGDSLRQSASLVNKTIGVLTGQRSLSELFTKSELSLAMKVGAVIAFREMAPDSLIAFVGDGLLYGRELYSYFGHVLYGVWDSYSTSFLEVSSMYSVTPIWDQYIDPSSGRWYKTLLGTGVFVGALAFVLGGYHVPRRLYDLVKDMRKPEYTNLIDRENKTKTNFATLIAEAEAKQQTLLNEKFKAEGGNQEETLARLEQVKIERGRELGWLSRMRVKLFGVKKGDTEIKTQLGAILHLLVGAANYRTTVGEYTPAFNWYASIRYSSFGWITSKTIEKHFGSRIPLMIKMRPFGIAARMVYPEFFKTSMSSRPDKITYPTALNGGTTSITTKIGRWVYNRLNTATPHEYPSHPQGKELMTQLANVGPEEVRSRAQLMDEFEDKVIDLEEVVIAESMKKAFSEFALFSKSDQDLKNLFTHSNGVLNMTAKEITLLNFRNKVFLRSYMDLLYHSSMGEVLKSGLGVTQDALEETDLFEMPELSSGGSDGVTTKADLLKLKERIIAAAQSKERGSVSSQLNVSSDVVAGIVQKQAARIDLLEMAKKKANWAAMGLPDFKTLRNHIKAEVTSALDGSVNPAMRNYEIVRGMMKDEVAMARATRNEISTLFRTLPIDIGMKFIATAGITVGLMAPIVDQFWGDNSVAYLSQYSFYGGLLGGIAFSSVSSAWGKLRQDYYDATDGLFGEIPEGEDANSYVKWFWKKWTARDNSLFKYWGNTIKILFWNIPAAIPQMMLMDYLFINRFDFDAFLIGYISAFALPFSAFMMKVDQVFEQSAYYAARGLKPSDLSDPEVQKWLQPEMQKLRNKVTVVRDLLINPLDEMLMNAEVTPTDSTGPRALMRYMFGGYTPTELIVLKMREAAEASPSTIVKKILSGCEKFLTNGNPDLIKLKQ